MTAAERWRRQLEDWAIPDELLERVEESPYGWSQTLWKRRSQVSEERPETPTVGIVAGLLTAPGVIVDIGIGRGRASLPLAQLGHRVIGVDESAEMLDGLAEDAAALGVRVERHQGRWPDVAATVPSADVVMAANVAYNVSDIEPFLRHALDHAGVALVLEVTDRHPWAHLAPLYEEVHGLERPDGPTAGDLVAVVEDLFDRQPEVHRWERPGQIWFESWDELIEHYGRRLVVPVADRPRLRPILEPGVNVDAAGHLTVGSGATGFTTLVVRA